MADSTSRLRLVVDGLKNVLTGRGTAIDKAAHSFWHHTKMPDEQVVAAYRASWLIRKIVDLPADDMTREWRVWELKPDQVKKIEAEERRLRVAETILEGLVLGRLGGGIVVVGTDGDMGAKAQDGEKLIYLAALPRRVVTLGTMDWDVDSPTFGQPSSFILNGARGARDELHPSRVIVFKGERVPTLTGLETEEAFWGDAVVEVVDQAVKNVNTTTDGFAGLVDEAKIDIFRLAGLANTLMQADGETKIAQRVETTNLGKSSYRAVYLDAEDEWTQKQLNWAGMPDLIKTMLMVAAGAADIPATRLYGKAPDGQNSTGESDDRNYRSMIKTKQNRTLRPALELIDRFLLPELSIPVDSAWEFNPLTTLSEKEQSAVDKERAETAKIWDGSGLIPREAFARAAQSMLVENGTYPSLGEELEKIPEAERVPDPEENFNDPSAFANPQLDPAKAAGGKPAVRPRMQLAKDAEPRSLYVFRKVLNAAEIVAWAKEQGFTSTLDADDMHVSIMHSHTAVDWMTIETGWGEDEDGGLKIRPGGARLVEPIGNHGAVALLFNSSELSWRHEAIKQAGAQHSHDDFQPHITLTYKAPEGLDLRSIEPFRGAIRLGREEFREVNTDWTPPAQ